MFTDSAVSMIISDVDGTLVPEGAGELPEEILDTFRSLQNMGILTAVVSGRDIEDLRTLFAPVKEKMFFGSEGGLLLQGGSGGLLYASRLSREMAENLAGHVRAYRKSGGDIGILMRSPKGWYALPDHEALLRKLAGCKVNILDGYQKLPEEICKISLYCPDGAVHFLRYLEGRWTPDCHIEVGGKQRQWVEMYCGEKGDCVRHLLEILRIPARQVCYFGDSYSDMSVLGMVGHPWVMSTAPRIMRNYFPCHTDDVGRTIREWLCPPSKTA